MRLFSPLWLLIGLGPLFSSPLFALTLVIDPGHGGSDAGAHRDGVNESSINLRLAKMLYEKLKASETFKPHLTRTEDVNVSLSERVEFAHQINADLFLSIHANASSDPRARGAEFYFQNQLEPNEASAFLAHQENQLNLGPAQKRDSLVQPRWPQSLKTIFFDLIDQSRVQRSFLLSKSLRENWQGHKKERALSLKQAPFHVISRTEAPSTLVEVGFLTNTTDFNSLKSDNYLEKIAESLVKGLHDYKLKTQDL